ncbi:hypothetical protein, partial [Parachitinimonas caeni]
MQIAHIQVHLRIIGEASCGDQISHTARLEVGYPIQADVLQLRPTDLHLQFNRRALRKAIVSLQAKGGIAGETGFGGEEQGLAVGSEAGCAVFGAEDA